MTRGAPQWLRAVAGPNGLTFTGWLLVGVPAVAGGAAMLAGVLREDLLEALAWGVISWIALGGVWWVARLTWMSGGSPRRRQILIVPTYVLGGAVRAAIIAMSSPTGDGRTTIAVSVVNITLLSIVLSAVVDRLRTLDLAAGRLEVVRAGLVDAGARAAQETAQLRAHATETVLAGLRHVLNQDLDATGVAQGLRDVSDRVVRPMSHEMASGAVVRADAADGPEPSSRGAYLQPRRDIPSVARAMLDDGPIRPLVTTLLYSVFALPVTYYIFGWPVMLAVLTVTAVFILALLGLARLIPWRRLPTLWGSVLLALVLVVTGAASVMVLQLGPGAEVAFAGGAVYAAMFLALVGGSVAGLRGLAHRQTQIEESLVEATSELADVVRADQAELRRTRRHLARVLHGVVQPRLVARALQLQSTDGPIDVVALESEVLALLSDGPQATEPVDIARALRDIAEIWADSVDVSVDVPEAVATALAHQQACALAIADVACEAVNNAVLRGGARHVDVIVQWESARARLLVVNDVTTAPSIPGSPGLGTQVYEELSDAWGVTVGDGRAEFWADFTVAPRGGTGLSMPGPRSRFASGVLADDFGVVG